jgi:2-polyprenyl-3-methyl-5-hydroxy-6-metoxy-1,4-benzoquinol methylase
MPEKKNFEITYLSWYNMHEDKHGSHEHKEGRGQGYKGIDEGERRKMMDPNIILPKIGLKPGMTLVDVGCGQGFFAMPAARIAGPKGCVYGIDIDKEALDLLGLKASDTGLNIQILQGEAEKRRRSSSRKQTLI